MKNFAPPVQFIRLVDDRGIHFVNLAQVRVATLVSAPLGQILTLHLDSVPITEENVFSTSDPGQIRRFQELLGFDLDDD